MPRHTPQRRFAALLSAIVVAGVALRVVYVLTVTQHDHRLYDATYYELQAETIVAGEGFFTDPFLTLRNPKVVSPAADHPPLVVIAMLPAATLDSQHASNLAMRFTNVVFGAMTIVVIALLARAVAGPTAGLVGATVAALDPNLWMNDGLIMSESLAVLLIGGLVAVCWQVLHDRITPPRVAILGALAALATLTRAELGVFLVMMVVPTLWIAAQDRAERLRTVGGAIAVFLLVLAPWCAYNLSRFERPVLVSTGAGLALRSSSCPSTYYGSTIGWSDVFPPCALPRDDKDQSVWDEDNRREAISYIRGHLTRTPLVMAARLGRIWNVFNVGQSVHLSTAEGRPVPAGWLGAITTWLSVPLAVMGAMVLRRRGERIWPLIVPVVGLSLTVAMIAAGLLRYRAPAEPALVVLVSVALAAVIDARRDRVAPTM